jgi:dipeptide/tripeptide permease
MTKVHNMYVWKLHKNPLKLLKKTGRKRVIKEVNFIKVQCVHMWKYYNEILRNDTMKLICTINVWYRPVMKKSRKMKKKKRNACFGVTFVLLKFMFIWMRLRQFF